MRKNYFTTMTFKVEERETEEEQSFVCKSDEENGDESEENKAAEEGVGCRVLGGSFEGESEEDHSSFEGEHSSEGEVGYRVGGRQGEGAGRFLLAAKTFQPGQQVLLESPLVQVSMLSLWKSN